MTELLDITVSSPCIRSSSLLSSAASGRLLTELLWELALMDMLGMDWLLPTLFTVPVRPAPCSGSCTQTDNRCLQTNYKQSQNHQAKACFCQSCINFSSSSIQPKCEKLDCLTSSPSWDSVAGPLCASWKRIFFILRYCRLSSSRTASLVRKIRSIKTVSGLSRWTKACCVHRSSIRRCDY